MLQICSDFWILYPIGTHMVLILGWIVEAYSNETCTAMLTNGYPPFSDDLRVEIENYAVS